MKLTPAKELAASVENLKEVRTDKLESEAAARIKLAASLGNFTTNLGFKLDYGVADINGLVRRLRDNGYEVEFLNNSRAYELRVKWECN